jgi:ATP-dependent helicase/nuclease subunit A
MLNDSLNDYAQMASAAAEVTNWKHVAELASSALETGVIREAATQEHWLELPMATVEGETVLEGVADLVYRNSLGKLVIVDFKTDNLLTEETLSGYWAQLSAYANMINKATGELVAQLTLIQCSKSPARVLNAYLKEST